MTSRSFGDHESPRIPHLGARPRSEIFDLRGDVDRAFSRLETEVDGLTGADPHTTVTDVQTGASVVAAVNETVRCDPTSNAQAVQLPAIGTDNKGRLIEVKVVLGASPGTPLTHNVTLVPAGGDTIDGAASFAITMQRGSVSVRSDGSSDWMVV